MDSSGRFPSVLEGNVSQILFERRTERLDALEEYMAAKSRIDEHATVVAGVSKSNAERNVDANGADPHAQTGVRDR